MTLASLLKNWRFTRSSASTWNALLAGDQVPESLVRAVASALARPIPEAQVVRELVGEGAFDAAALLLADDGFLSSPGGELAHALDGELEQARSAHVGRMRGRLTELDARAARLGIPLNVADFERRLGGSRADDEGLLDGLGARIRAAEDAQVAELRGRLHALAEAQVGNPLFDAWKASVEQALLFGALGAAEAALDRGPSDDVVRAFEVPPPPVWPYRAEPLDRVVGWFLGEGVVPPGFERYLPSAEDEPALAFLRSVARPGAKASEAALRAMAGILGCTLTEIEETEKGFTGCLSDLSAPGLHALGRARWPTGVPIWLSDKTDDPDPAVTDGNLLVRLVLGRGARRAERVLHLAVDDVLAVLHDPRRRERLIAHLGRQLPLDTAFDACFADLSVRWERSDVRDLVELDKPPTLLIGAPGMGKSTLLKEIARVSGGALMEAGKEVELPSAPVVLVDGVDVGDESRVRQLVREIHWALTTRVPAPVVVVAARPEARALFDRIGASMFEAYHLPARSLGALREQAVTMLAWVGIQAQNPGSYDRMAHLAGGNPTVLFHLCRALTESMGRGQGGRRFTPGQLEDAWGSVSFNDAVRKLLWEPIERVDGAAETVRALCDYASLGAPLSLTDLAWALGDGGGERAHEWVVSRLDLLVAYGLVDREGAGYRVALGGPGMLARAWVST